MFRSLLLISLFVFISCTSPHGRKGVWQEEGGKVKVLTTLSMISDLVAQIGGEEIDTHTLIGDELDPHSYELVKGDDEKFARADVIFYNGLGLEHGLSLRQNLEGNPKAVALSDALLDRRADQILLIDGQYDPHVWMDISLWVETLPTIVETLSKIDPTHATLFRMRGEALRTEMLKADEEALATLQAVPAEKRFLVTSHDAFQYFTRRYLAVPGEEDWKKRCAAPEGLAPDAQLSVTDLAEIVSHIDRFGVAVLFPESNINRDALRKIVSASKERGRVVRLCEEPLYGDAMGEASSYLEMIAHNVHVIARALQGET